MSDDQLPENFYTEVLKKQLNTESLEDCCFNIVTEFSQYNYCFIDMETENFLGISVTHSDFTERFVLLEKKYIVSVHVVYQQDLSESDVNHDAYI